jgi:hypothetical protein
MAAGAHVSQLVHDMKVDEDAVFAQITKNNKELRRLRLGKQSVIECPFEDTAEAEEEDDSNV